MIGSPHDVIVVGAGPAGSTAAALLAADGWRVLVLEREAFPRFKIGESLLPGCMPVLERLGVEPDPRTHVFKRGAEFVCEASGRSRVFAFDEALDGCPKHAWHVDRARFDTLLRDRARAAGADVRHGESVEGVEIDDARVRVRTRTSAHEGRYLIDATGQARLLARHHRSERPIDRFGHTAAYTHFEGLSDDARAVFGEANDIRIMMRPEGWGWILPLPGRRLSVGIVSHGTVTPEDLERGLLAGPLMTRLAAGARRLQTRRVGSFSYANERPVGARFATVGDAACFLDPVFSSGVTLALRGAQSIADALGPALAEEREADPELLAEHVAASDRAHRTFAGLIDRFYHSPAAAEMFLGDARGMPLRNGVLTVLAGDVWRHDNPYQDLLLRARRRRASVREAPR